MARVVVIGAGLGGLAAAARLGRAGHAVTVLEQASTWGGKLGWYERDGYAFDTGPSLLTLPQTYRDLFKKTGRPLERVLPLEPLAVTAHYRFGDGTEMDVPNGSSFQVANAFGEALGGTAAQDWTRFSAHTGQVWQATRATFLENALGGPRQLLRESMRVRDLALIAPWRSLRDVGRRFLSDERQRTYLDRYATYAGSDPRRAPAALCVIPYMEQEFGAWYVPGGLRRLGAAVLARAEQRGAVVRYGADVTRITVTDSGHVDGVVLSDGERVPADVVVANADAWHVYERLLHPADGGAPARTVTGAAARLARATPSLAGFVLLLALRGRTPGLRHHTVLFPQNYDDEFDSIFGAKPRPVPDPTIYISAPDDPALRPDDDSEAWFVLVNAPRHDPAGGVDWTAPGLADAYADRVLALMAERGLDVRDRVRWRVVNTPAELESRTRAPGGSIYGTSSNGARAAFLRPSNQSPVPGLFLVGGSAHPGGGMPLVALSAQIVAGLIGPA